MKRGEVYNARLDPTEGSEQAGNRPIIIVSRDAINASSSVVIVVPCTTYPPQQHIYPSQVLIQAPDGGLSADSVALGEQVRALAKTRLGSLRGVLCASALEQLNQALLVALDLPNEG